MSRVEVIESDCDEGRGRVLAQRLKLRFVHSDSQHYDSPAPLVDVDRFLLQYLPSGLNLTVITDGQRLSSCADFDAPTLRHRARTGLASQPLIKALGIKKNAFPTVIDATAGFAKDAYLMARAGCDVVMTERSKVVCALLEDGLSRSMADHSEAAAEIDEDQRAHLRSLARMTLVPQDFLKAKLDPVDVVYLDPMFPHKKKSAQVKKDMYVLQRLFGSSTPEHGDSSGENAVFERALGLAQKRVVVKRPRNAPTLASDSESRKPSYQYVGKTNRYDIYLTS